MFLEIFKDIVFGSIAFKLLFQLNKHNDTFATLSLNIRNAYSRCVFNGFKGDAIKVKITSSPIEGRANKACVNFLAKEFGVAKSNVEIIGGHQSRMKRVRVMGIPPHEMERIIRGKMGIK